MLKCDNVPFGKEFMSEPGYIKVTSKFLVLNFDSVTGDLLRRIWLVKLINQCAHNRHVPVLKPMKFIVSYCLLRNPIAF